MDRMEKGVGGGSRGGCRRRICRQWLLATGAKRLNEAGKDKASNKLDIRETERERGLRSCSKKAVIWHSSPRSVPEDWAGFCRFIWFVHPPRHLVSSLFLLSLRAHSHTLRFLRRNTSVYLQKPHCLTAAQVPIPFSVCLLHSLHNAGINFPKPIWAAARFGKRAESRTFVLGEVSPSH